MKFKRMISALTAMVIAFTVTGSVLPRPQTDAVAIMPINAVIEPVLSRTSMTMAAGEAVKLKLAGAEAVSWSSSNKSVASVSASGKVSARKSGTAVISVKTSTDTYECKVTVRKYRFANSKTAITEGGTVTLKVYGKTAGKTIIWSSSNPAVAAVNKNGKVTGIGAGTATVSAKIGSVKISRKITVREKAAETTVQVTTPPVTTTVTTTTAVTTTPPVTTVPEVPAVIGKSTLYGRFSDYFKVGAAVGVVNYDWGKHGLDDSDYVYVITGNFNSITAENAMKPDAVLDQSGSMNSSTGMPVIKVDTIKKYLDFAKENNIKVRYHTLIWHSQIPEWFFKEGYKADSKTVTKEVMIKRMESYIKQVMTYINANYPGVVYAYDVVNEAITDAARSYYWYKIFGGDGYIDYAFKFARQYCEEGAVLIYNDYGCYWPGKRNEIYEMVKRVNAGEKLIDGVGMQMHVGVYSPRITGADTAEWDGGSIETAIRKFASLGVEVQITELDVSGAANESIAGDRYKSIFKLLVDLDKEKDTDITSVTVWGLFDRDSWIRDSSKYPLLFGNDLKPNDAYNKIMTIGN